MTRLWLLQWWNRCATCLLCVARLLDRCRSASSPPAPPAAKAIHQESATGDQPLGRWQFQWQWMWQGTRVNWTAVGGTVEQRWTCALSNRWQDLRASTPATRVSARQTTTVRCFPWSAISRQTRHYCCCCTRGRGRGGRAGTRAGVARRRKTKTTTTVHWTP